MAQPTVNLTFDAKCINNMEPQSSDRIYIDVDTNYINEVLEDIPDDVLIEYAKEKVLDSLGPQELLSRVTTSAVIHYYDVNDLMEAIGKDVLIRYIQNDE
jgi:hypothetical protein